MEKIDKKAVLDLIDGYVLDDLDSGYLTSAINSLPTSDEWVSVEDRLPGNYDLVLLYDGWEYQIGKLYNNPPVPKTAVWVDRLSESGIDYITHWMPLPKSPTK